MSTTWLAGCKINLGLHVLRRRSDGYHDIESVLIPVPWYDTIQVEPAEKDEFSCSDLLLPVDERNLCVRAVHLFRGRFGQTRPLRIHLEKNLPTGAGLGGGSSDAAAILRGLARLNDIPASEPDLMTIAAALGSDVPFFLLDRARVSGHGPHTAEPREVPALATGRGEILEALTSTDGGAFRFPYALVIATPDVSISTADAYAGVTPNDYARPSLREAVVSGSPTMWRASIANDFEPFVFSAFPQLSVVKDMLYGAGALYASLSGSGSAVYGVFAEIGASTDATRVLVERGVTGWCGTMEGGYALSEA